MGDAENAIVRVIGNIGDVSAGEWDACANPEAEHFNPFLSHAFLKALEVSGSVSAKAGWVPCHLVLEDGNGGIRGAMPLYLKSHSLGEYVFDHAWASAYERAGGQYYPKLLSAVPFTPVTGKRLLALPGPSQVQSERLLLRAALELMRRESVSSLHINFPTEKEWKMHAGLLLQRTGVQFHWQNEDYSSFDAFLDRFASRKRKVLRKERREALADGISIEWLTGDEISEAHWDAFFRFYMDTGSRKWGRPYLNRRFFSLVGEAMRKHILLVMAKRAGRYIAGALNFIGGNTLYGRYWGTIEDHPFLHFEVCYYQAIEFAIERKLARVEAGAQGEHKLTRGYEPQTTYSLHYFADPGLSDAVAHYLSRERPAIVEEIQQLRGMLPFKASCAADQV